MADVIVTGSFNQDLTFRTPRFPAPGETRLGEFQTGPGGKGFNQAIAARRLGVDTLFIGALGNDVFATGARRYAERRSLRCSFENVADCATGTAAILVDDEAQNQIVVAPGANARLSVAHIERHAHEFAAAKLVLTQLETNPGAAARALELGRDKGAITILNPAPIHDEADAGLLEHVDILIPNESEFLWLCERLPRLTPPRELDGVADEELHALCRATGVPTVIITLGARGAFVSQGPEAPRHPASLPWYTVDAAAVDPVDTTGAGDAFNGALAAALVRFGAQKLNMAVQFANQVAGLATERPGAADAMPDQHAVARRFS